MYQPKLFYLNIEYGKRIFNFYLKKGDNYQHGVKHIKGSHLYDSDEFVNEKGVKGCHTLSGFTLDAILEGIIKIK